MQICLPGTGVALDERVGHAVSLLRENEPEEGYYFAFSGGKDSCAVDKLLQMAGVRYRKHYANVTIDPPELVRFIKKFHPDAIWNQPEHGNMFVRIAERPGLPPTRMARWCCDEYKENHGKGTVKVFGVRQQESPKRKHNWREVTRDQGGDKSVCPIVFWSGETLLPPGMEPPVDPSLVLRVGDVWDFIEEYAVPYCPLYEEGWSRLGCVGCMLNPQSRVREFRRWPRYAQKWEQAVKANWEKFRHAKRKDGKPYAHSNFATAEDFWKWFMEEARSDVIREDCQSMIMWTNDDGDKDAADHKRESGRIRTNKEGGAQ